MEMPVRRTESIAARRFSFAPAAIIDAAINWPFVIRLVPVLAIIGAAHGAPTQSVLLIRATS
jgi:hypothetical protein